MRVLCLWCIRILVSFIKFHVVGVAWCCGRTWWCTKKELRRHRPQIYTEHISVHLNLFAVLDFVSFFLCISKCKSAEMHRCSIRGTYQAGIFICTPVPPPPCWRFRNHFSFAIANEILVAIHSRANCATSMICVDCVIRMAINMECKSKPKLSECSPLAQIG